MSEITRILSQINAGDETAAKDLFPLVYDELRKLSAQKMAREREGHLLQATGLVHEAYLRLMNVHSPQHWENRHHFFASAAEAMRRILIEDARRNASLKRGGRWQRRTLDDLDHVESPASSDPQELLDLDAALGKLNKVDPEAAELVQLRYFAGLTMEQAAEVLGISERAAYYQWNYARAWLRCEMDANEN